MKPAVTALLAMGLVASPLALPSPALAQPDYRWHDDRPGWDPSHDYRDQRRYDRRLRREDQVYRGGDGRYYCRRNNGTTGLVVGALGGGLAGNLLGGGTLGTLLGAGGGALLGRSIDRGKVHCR